LLAAAIASLASPNAAGALRSADESGTSERDVLALIASRPVETRDAALEASLYPDMLVRMELIQARSSAAFDVRAERLDREHQEELWELVRYEGAVSDIVEGGAKSRDELDAIADAYPDEARDVVLHLGAEHFDTLEEVHAVKVAADVEFEDAIAGLPDEAQDAFRTLVADPELLAAMGRSPSAVANVAAEFRDSPSAARAHLDELAAQVAADEAKAEREWRETVENDPEARRELETASRRYAEEYGYDYDDLTRRDVDVTVNVYNYAYPYWYGYPSWYAHWHPWGVWYPIVPHFGFAYRTPGAAFYFGLPSPHFVSWYFGGYYDAYPRLSHCFDRYYGHRYYTHRPYHRYARHARYSHRPSGGIFARSRRNRPDYVSPATLRAERREHGIARRAERRELGIERRVERRDRGVARRAERRDNGVERREQRRENGLERREERRDNGVERRAVRRENGVERREERRENGEQRRDERREAGVERRDERRTNASERVNRGLQRREVRRDTGEARREERRDVMRDRIDTRRERSEERRDRRRGDAPGDGASAVSPTRGVRASAPLERAPRASSARVDARAPRDAARAAARPERAPRTVERAARADARVVSRRDAADRRVAMREAASEARRSARANAPAVRERAPSRRDVAPAPRAAQPARERASRSGGEGEARRSRGGESRDERRGRRQGER